MKNLTLAIDDDLLADFRLLAAQQRTTVNALVRKHMEDATNTAKRRKSALERLTLLSRQSEAFDAANPVAASADSTRLSRAETYTGPRFEWPRP